MNSIYERYKLYRANPCDLDSWTIFKPLSRTLMRVTAAFTTQCSCCSGARIVLGLAVAAAIGRYTA
jgi:hypothetical protein